MGSSLKKTAPVVKEVSARDGMLSMIKQGGSTLKKADTSSNPLGKKPNEKPDQVQTGCIKLAISLSTWCIVLAQTAF